MHAGQADEAMLYALLYFVRLQPRLAMAAMARLKSHRAH